MSPDLAALAAQIANAAPPLTPAQINTVAAVLRGVRK